MSSSNSRRCAWVLGGLLSLAGCAEDRGPRSDEGQVERTRHALIGNAADRTIFIVGATPAGENLPSILADEPTGQSWIKVEAPHASDGTATDWSEAKTFDLADPTVSVVFAASFLAVCNANDAAEPAEHCWVVLRHRAGDEGLEGSVTIHRTPEMLRLSYGMSWEGTYGDLGDQFDSPPDASFGWNTSAFEAIASQYVVEMPL